MKRQLLPGAIVGAVLAAFGIFAAFAASSDTTLNGGDQLTIHCAGSRLNTTRLSSTEVRASCVAAATPTPTRTPTTAPTATKTPTKTPTSVPATPTKTATPVPPTGTATSAPTATPTATASGGSSPIIGGCPVFPSNNAWNTKINAFAVDPNSANYMAGIAGLGGNQKLHPDFGSDPTYGIPFVVVPSTQAMVPITYGAYGDESDPGPFPIPLNAPVEGGSGSSGDRHVLVVQQGSCKLYELYNAFQSGAGWTADSGAKWDLNSNATRTAGWTSADAAGLAILPGLVRYDEVKSGHIDHALRFTVSRTQKGYILPATHWASSYTNTNYLPMGARLRLRADFDISGYTGESKVILQALKTYGMIVADNGSNYFITGATDSRWNDTDLNQLKNLPGSAFEVVQTGPIVH